MALCDIASTGGISLESITMVCYGNRRIALCVARNGERLRSKFIVHGLVAFTAVTYSNSMAVFWTSFVRISGHWDLTWSGSSVSFTL